MRSLKSFKSQKKKTLTSNFTCRCFRKYECRWENPVTQFCHSRDDRTLAEESDVRAEIQLAIITFGYQANIHTPLSNVNSISWTDMTTSGGTPMGGAFQLTTTMFQDRNTISGRAYRPTIVLVSDGQPTDDYRSALQALLSDERASKGFRMALAIGDDADKRVLQESLADAENNRVFEVYEARKIRDFFQLVTMSVSSRSKSANPNSGNILSHIPDLDWEL